MDIYTCILYIYIGHMVAQWLRHCATNRQFEVSIPDCVIGIFHCHIHSGPTMALRSNQSRTEISTRYISQEKRRPMCKADNLNTILCRFNEIWNHNFLQPYGTLHVCNGIALPLCIYRVSHEGCARLQKGVPYVKVYRYNPKYLC